MKEPRASASIRSAIASPETPCSARLPTSSLAAVDYLLPTSVGERDRDPSCPGWARGLECLGSVDESVREQVKTAHKPHGDIVSGDLCRDVAEQIDQDVVIGFQLLLRPGEILGGQKPTSDRTDLQVLCPAQELDELLHAFAVTSGVVRQTLGTGIATVSVMDYTDVLRQLVTLEEFEDPRFVDPVQGLLDHSFGLVPVQHGAESTPPSNQRGLAEIQLPSRAGDSRGESD